MAGFSTVSLMRESPDVVAKFAAYYRELGAEEALVYVDGPLGDLAGLEAPGLTLIATDADFWTALGVARPEGLEARQVAIYLAGLARARTEWLAVVDADEFVFGDRPVAEFLDRIPKDADSVSLPTAEAVWGPGDDIDAPFGSTFFRTRWSSDLAWRALRRPVYGAAGAFMRHGLLGHTMGKQFLRVGPQYTEIGNHDTKRGDAVITRRASALGLPKMYVGHFDAIGLARWTQKWRQRISRETLTSKMAPVRQSQMDAIAAALNSGDAATRRLFKAFYGLSGLQFRTVAAMGFGFRRNLF